MTTIFPTALSLKTSSSMLVTHNEVRSIENSVLLASSLNLLDVTIINSYFTNTVIPTFQTITAVDATLNTLTVPTHGLTTGDEVVLATTVTLPSPLVPNTSYFALVIDPNTLKISDSFIHVVNSIAIDLLDTGTGTHSIRSIAPSEKYYKTWQGTRTDRAMILQMNTVIDYFTGLGYSIKRVTNPDVPSVFEWVLSW